MKKVLFFSLAIISFQGFSETAEDLVSKMWASFKDSDLEMFSETMSKTSTMVTFGTDASERWEGWDALKASVKIQFDAFDVQNINRSEKVINYNSNKDVAWFSEVVDWEVLTGGEQTLIEGIRFTGVMEKINGEWLIVQFHSSVGVAGQVLEY